MNKNINIFKSAFSAFSLVELLIVLVIIAVVLAIGIPGINQARSSAEKETMRTRAISIQNAKLSLIDAIGLNTATTNWSGKTDQQRYQNLLLPYLPSTCPQTLTDYIRSPYTIDLNAAVDGNVILTNTSVTPAAVISLQKY
jgi:prepilin-type N-terminal cleavage/methylation domain-containing protein